MVHLSPFSPVTRPIPQKAPRFGHYPTMGMLNFLDFNSVGASTVGQNKVIYAAVILSRLAKARSANEFRENITRDGLGWYSWFMGGPLMQTAFALCMVPLVCKAAQPLMITRLNQKANVGKKILYTLFSPSSLWLLATDKQLHQRKEQVLQGMKASKAVAASQLQRTANLFERTINLRSLTSLFGIAFTIFLLGFVINLVNIALTRANVRKKDQEKQMQSQQSSGFKANVNAEKLLDVLQRRLDTWQQEQNAKATPFKSSYHGFMQRV